MSEKSEQTYLNELLIQAEDGDPDAARPLGDAYREQQNWGPAMFWLTKAFELGDNLASFGLGVMYLHGQGCPPDPAKGKRYLIEAALSNDERAFRQLDPMIPELEEAVFRGDIDLLFQLPWLYFKGLGGSDCKAKAWAWMLWLEIQGPLPGGIGIQVILDFSDMEQQFSYSATRHADKEKGRLIFEQMKRDHAIPPYPTLEEILGGDMDAVGE